MHMMNCRDFVDLIYGKSFGQDFSKYQLADDVEIVSLFNEIIELVEENVTTAGCELGLFLPSGVYMPSSEMVDEANARKEEIERLRNSLEDAERSFQAAPINMGPFYRGSDNDDYDDEYGDYDDDGDYDGDY